MEGSGQIQCFKHNGRTQRRQSTGELMVNSPVGLPALRQGQVKKALPGGVA